VTETTKFAVGRHNGTEPTIGTTTGAIMIGIEPATIATGSQTTATVAANRDGGVGWFS
jgi:hypothetical protein